MAVAISRVAGSTARMAVTAERGPRLAPGVLSRDQVKATSSAVKGSPPWNRTPWRRWKRQSVGVTRSHLVASAGSITSLSSMRTRVSYMLARKALVKLTRELWGSSVRMSELNDQVSVLPAGCAKAGAANARIAARRVVVWRMGCSAGVGAA